MTSAFIFYASKDLLYVEMEIVLFEFLIAEFYILGTNAQEDVDTRPVRSPFSSGAILSTQSTQNLKKNMLEFNIQHRFDTISNAYEDFFGIFGSSNIRLDLRYRVMDKLSLGFGITKNNFLHDLNVKHTILQQTQSGEYTCFLKLFWRYGNRLSLQC